MTANNLAQNAAVLFSDGVIALIPEDISVTALRFPTFTLTQGFPWETDFPLNISATELANRWLHISGTEISGEIYEQLKRDLGSPSTLVVGLGEELKPYRLTFYELPQFWLMQNWESRWLAVSVESHYLFPFTKTQFPNSNSNSDSK
ncbi:hypothetical protein [Candidatus Enterovibrio altilux]|uniref:hypothetical protein n=1 Tax=Candidatus Enterovibrio altilux TaxID=1927128 RepID=UPI001CC245F0|nr:hypothetical protein [Candidatus Enterovibrio luxaltus]